MGLLALTIIRLYAYAHPQEGTLTVIGTTSACFKAQVNTHPANHTPTLLPSAACA